MSVNDNTPQTRLTELISTDDAENDALVYEPARLNLMNRAVEL